MNDAIPVCYCHDACVGGDVPGHEFNTPHHHTITHIHFKDIKQALADDMVQRAMHGSVDER